jgi:CRISPR/Cas system-associated exonuclease Cas4 (RecB family)
MGYREVTSLTRSGSGEFNAQEFQAAVVDVINSKARKDSFKTKKSFSPSGVGYGSGTCPRYWFLAFSGVEFVEQTDALGILNMENGSYVHERLQKMLTDSDLEVSLEDEILNEYPPIRGFADIIVKWKGMDVIGEIKSAKDEVYAIRKVTMQGLPYHVLQLLIYMKVKELTEGFLWYENKNTQEFIIIPVHMNARNTKIVNDAFSWMEKVWDNFQAGTLPERPFTKSSSSCKFCPVRNECWNVQPIGEVELPALVVKK